VTIGIEPFNHLCETAAGTIIAPGLLMPLLSEAEFERIIYDPPNRNIQASRRRSFTGAIRRIIEVRDRHCQLADDCFEPAARCDVDHITPYPQLPITCLCTGQIGCPTHNRIIKNAGRTRRPQTNAPVIRSPANTAPTSGHNRHQQHRFRRLPRPTHRSLMLAPVRATSGSIAWWARLLAPEMSGCRPAQRCLPTSIVRAATVSPFETVAALTLR